LTATGEVLDAASLIGDAGKLASTRAAARTANAEEQRLRRFTTAAPKLRCAAVESAQAAQIEGRTTRRSYGKLHFWCCNGDRSPKLSDAQRAARSKRWTGRTQHPAARGIFPAAAHSARCRGRRWSLSMARRWPHACSVRSSAAPPIRRAWACCCRSITCPPESARARACSSRCRAARIRALLVPSAALLYGDQGRLRLSAHRRRHHDQEWQAAVRTGAGQAACRPRGRPGSCRASTMTISSWPTVQASLVAAGAGHLLGRGRGHD